MVLVVEGRDKDGGGEDVAICAEHSRYENSNMLTADSIEKQATEAMKPTVSYVLIIISH